MTGEPLNLHALKLYSFKNANLATLTTNVIKFLNGQAVTNIETGTVAYPANESRNKRLLGYQYGVIAGPEYSLVIFYAE